MADNCSPCSSTPAPCTDCTQIMQQINYCDDGCVEITYTDCVKFSGNTITLGNGVVISNSEDLTTIIKKLAGNNADVTLQAEFNPQSRILTLSKNGVIYFSQQIPDQDNQYLVPNNGKLEIWSNTPNGAIKINDVDMSVFFNETTFAATSSTLTIAPGGIKGHSPAIELVPSSDTGNKLSIGSDGKPFVPPDAAGIKDVIIQPVQGLTFTRSVQNGVITFTPVLDFQYIADMICPLCNPSCGTPSGLNVESV